MAKRAAWKTTVRKAVKFVKKHHGKKTCFKLESKVKGKTVKKAFPEVKRAFRDRSGNFCVIL